MPGDLSNPEFSIPYHYDSKYDPGTNPFDTRGLNSTQIIQAIAREVRGYPLTKEELVQAMGYLENNGMAYRNPGEQAFQEAVHAFMKALKSARKVAARCLI